MKILGYTVPAFRNLNKREPERAKVFQKIQQYVVTRTRQDLVKWRLALQSAENVLMPRRYLLADNYRQVVLDAHLSSLMQTRKLMTLSKPFKLTGPDGHEQPDKTALLEKEWFRTFVDYALDSIFYGYSVIELGDVAEAAYQRVTLIPYDFIAPEQEVVLRFRGDVEGMKFKETPYDDWTIWVGQENNLGLLLKAGPLVLWKQSTLGAWAEFAEMFGMPFRMGKTDMYSEEMKNNMVEMLSKMGGAGWGVFHKDDDISFIESKRSDAHQVYLELLNYADGQLSKLILGQTGTTDEKAFAGSAQVHQGIAEQYAQADARMIENVVNGKLLPLMLKHGFDVGGLTFKFDYTEKVTLQQQFEMVSTLLPYKDIPAQWIRDTFGIPCEEKAAGN